MKAIKSMTVNGRNIKKCFVGSGSLYEAPTGDYELLEYAQNTSPQYIDTA